SGPCFSLPTAAIRSRMGIRREDPGGGSPLTAGHRSNHQPLHRTVSRPHFLQIVELADLWAKDMDDDVAGINQHPIALGLALDADPAIAFLFELPDEWVGDGSNMPLRSPRGEHHMVADRGFASQIDAGDVLCLSGIERVEHDGEQAFRIDAQCRTSDSG